MDGAPVSSILIAINKAWTAARERKPTKEIGDQIKHPEKAHDIAYYGDPKYVGWVPAQRKTGRKRSWRRSWESRGRQSLLLRTVNMILRSRWLSGSHAHLGRAWKKCLSGKMVCLTEVEKSLIRRSLT
jgi:Haem-degrading